MTSKTDKEPVLELSIQTTPGRVARWLTGCILFLLAAHVAGMFMTFYWGHPTVFGLVPMFDLNEEQNIPTMYSTLALLFAAFVTLLITCNSLRQQSDWTRHWAGLVVLFVFMAIDDFVGIHELTNSPLRRLLDVSGVLHFAWVIPYLALAVVVGIAYWRFLFRLPPRTRWLLVLSGVVFTAGSIGFEIIIGHMVATGLRDSITTAVCIALEEFLELVAVVILIYTLLRHLRDMIGTVNVTIALNRNGSSKAEPR
ncbi:MAG: hypothetical protein O3A51_00885 [Verrucomicrobia bacterium]|nr:hypothetical protein [Verrucomicrobiota bacterium]